MKELIQNFPLQLEEAIQIGKSYKSNLPKSGYANVVVSGLGGSGIGADLVREYVAPHLSVPFIVSKDYVIPNFINSNTLFIASSYSGNTEETLESIKVAIKKKAKIVCITSGGKLAEIAKKNKFDLILIPGGNPPRSCLGYSFVQQLFILKNAVLLKIDFEKELLASIALLRKDEKSIKKEAEKIAKNIFDKTPVIYAIDGNAAVAVRFRQQVNENGKQLCWHHIVPEMNHNELVAWRTKDEKLAVVIFRNETDNKRSQVRVELNKKIIKEYTKTIIEIWSKGNSYLERAMYLIHLGDWASWHLSELRNFDCTEVKVIDWLKGELAKV